MRKIILFIIAVGSVCISMAQTSEADKNAALQLVISHRAVLGISADDLGNLAVSSSYIDRSAGAIRIVYLQKNYKGIPVYNKIQALAFKNDELVANSGRMEDIAAISKHTEVAPSLSAESAIHAALTDRGLVSSQPAILLSSKEMGKGWNSRTWVSPAKILLHS